MLPSDIENIFDTILTCSHPQKDVRPLFPDEEEDVDDASRTWPPRGQDEGDSDDDNKLSSPHFEEEEEISYENSVKDPSRVQLRRDMAVKNDENTKHERTENIFKDVEKLGFSDQVIKIANNLFQDVNDIASLRGNSRRAVVFACIFHAFKIIGKPQSHERLMMMFNLNRKAGLRGLKYVNLHVPKSSVIHNICITPTNLISELMEKFDAKESQKAEVVRIFDKVKNRSSSLNRARPQSVAAGITYYWILDNDINIQIKDFAKKAELSELTILKITREISSLMKKINEKNHDDNNKEEEHE